MNYPVLLYFATGDGFNATGEALVVPLEEVAAIEPTAATTCEIYLKGGNFRSVQLTFTSGKFKEVMQSIAVNINQAAKGSGFVVVCDSDNSKFIHRFITDCAIRR